MKQMMFRRYGGAFFLLFLSVSIVSFGLQFSIISDGSQSFLDEFRLNENKADTANIINTDLNLYANDQVKPIVISFSKNGLYNVTIQNTGDASIFAYIVQNITTYVSTTMQTSSVYSDELLESVGIPWWGTYNTWDTSSYSNRVSIGANIASKTQKTILFYLDNSFSTSTIPLTVLLRLQSTTNPYNNTVQIDWNPIAISNPATTFNYTDGNDNNSFECAPNSLNVVQFVSKEGIDRTVSVLNETIGVNSSLNIFQWRTDLSGNTIVSRKSQSGNTNTIFVPEFENFRLNGQIFLGLISNTLPVYSQLTWNFSVPDISLNYSTMSYYDPEIVEMPLNHLNIYWRTLEVPADRQFILNISADPLSSITNWDVSVDVYAIGSSNGILFNLNNYVANYSESATLFTMTHTTDYANYDIDYLKNNYADCSYFWVEKGIESPTVLNNQGTQRLGLKISATHNLLAVQNIFCKIEILDQSISNLNTGEYMKIGSINGTTFNGYAPFQIRKFSFNNFAQYKWSVHTLNATPMNTATQIRCNNIDSDKYVNNMNNSLISIAIDTSTFMGSISLEFDLAGAISQNDALHVQVRNSTKSSTDFGTFSNVALNNFVHYAYDISAYNDTAVQIIFNLTTNANGINEGPILDNIKVSVGSNLVFSDDFEGLFDKWVSYDHTGAGNLWRTDRYTASTNTPRISILYPNTEYTFNAYEADPFEYTNFTYNIYDYNPYVQKGTTGYIVVSASSALVQNFTVCITPTLLDVIPITNTTYIRAPYTNTNLISQNGIMWEETVFMADSYNYYRLDMVVGIYLLMFRISASPLIYFATNIYNAQGQIWNSNVENFYGTFFINQTFQINSTVNQSIFFDFGNIGYGREIQIIIWEIKATAPVNNTNSDDTDDSSPEISPPQQDYTLVIVAFGLFGASAVLNIVLGTRVKKIKKDMKTSKDIPK